MKKPLTIVIVLALVASGAFMFAISDEKTEGTAEQRTSGLIQAKDFTLKTLNGEEISLSDYRGKVVILDFWATWCPPCIKEIPHFNALSSEFAEKGLVVLGVSIDKGGVKAVEKFKKGTELNYQVVMYNEATYAEYQSYLPKAEQGGIPFTFVIDKEGNIQNYYVGYRPKEVFLEAIKPLL